VKKHITAGILARGLVLVSNQHASACFCGSWNGGFSLGVGVSVHFSGSWNGCCAAPCGANFGGGYAPFGGYGGYGAPCAVAYDSGYGYSTQGATGTACGYGYQPQTTAAYTPNYGYQQVGYTYQNAGYNQYPSYSYGGQAPSYWYGR